MNIGHHETCGICHTSGVCEHTLARLSEAVCGGDDDLPCGECGEKLDDHSVTGHEWRPAKETPEECALRFARAECAGLRAIIEKQNRMLMRRQEHIEAMRAEINALRAKAAP